MKRLSLLLLLPTLVLCGCSGGDPAPEVGTNAVGTEGVPSPDSPEIKEKTAQRNGETSTGQQSRR